MTNTLVSRKRTIQISANATSGIIDTNTPVVLKNNLISGPNRLDDLNDVNANNEIDGATLVYDASNDKYIVKVLDLSNVSGVLDGGTF